MQQSFRVALTLKVYTVLWKSDLWWLEWRTKNPSRRNFNLLRN